MFYTNMGTNTVHVEMIRLLEILMKPIKKLLILLILILWMAIAVVTAQETSRVALVIGNGDC